MIPNNRPDPKMTHIQRAAWMKAYGHPEMLLLTHIEMGIMAGTIKQQGQELKKIDDAIAKFAKKVAGREFSIILLVRMAREKQWEDSHPFRALWRRLWKLKPRAAGKMEAPLPWPQPANWPTPNPIPQPHSAERKTNSTGPDSPPSTQPPTPHPTGQR